MRFRVKNGKHHENGVKYGKNDVVESDRPLDKLFVNKFEVLPDEPSTPKAKKAAKVVAEGEEVETEEDPKDATGASIKSTQKEGVMDRPNKDVDSSALSSELGDNVTTDFPTALDAGVVVFKDGNKYQIAKPDDVETALNEKPLTKKEVNDFIKEL